MDARPGKLFRVRRDVDVLRLVKRRAASFISCCVGISFCATPQASIACDLVKALFEKWPPQQKLESPIDFVASNGVSISVTRVGVEQYSGSDKCIASVRLIARKNRDYKETLKSFSYNRERIEDYSLSEQIAESKVLDLIRESCSPERIKICISNEHDKTCFPNYVYIRDDGSIERRGMGLCAP